ASLLAGNTAGNSVANDFFTFGGAGQTNVENTTQIVATRSATLQNLYVNLTAAPGGVANKTVTVRVNGVNTALAVNVAGAATTGSNIANTVAIVAGDLISVQVTHAGAPVASDVMMGFEYSNSATPTNAVSIGRRTTDNTLAASS